MAEPKDVGGKPGKYGSLIARARQGGDQSDEQVVEVPDAQPMAQDIADEPEPVRESTMPLYQIKDRATNTRELSPTHVDALAESIAAIGLIEPLAVDQKGQVLAGGHRLAAIRQLKETNPEAYSQKFEGDRIPVRVMPFDAEADPGRALQIEVAENEQRRDYTPTEVKALAERLKSAGYKASKGRPTVGEKPLLPALEVIVGKSISTLKRYLQDEPKSEKIENSSNELFIQKRHLKQAHKALVKWQQGTEGSELSSQEEKLLKQLPSFLALVEKLSE